ncbi:hypothetical protein H2200_011472 [Cladophialophora chaetospira]|uniref:Uncharacterized protein n=1 Tax=Cladophialophora chaetospira TaxID=386627 RepID=A0AA39CD59_9EURO|nr:hypothetical protein H2200_011472 [Cladophialophora chaetospira]
MSWDIRESLNITFQQLMIHRYHHHRRRVHVQLYWFREFSGSFSNEHMNYPGLVDYEEVEEVLKQREGLSKNWPQIGVLDVCSGIVKSFLLMKMEKKIAFTSTLRI